MGVQESDDRLHKCQPNCIWIAHGHLKENTPERVVVEKWRAGLLCSSTKDLITSEECCTGNSAQMPKRSNGLQNTVVLAKVRIVLLLALLKLVPRSKMGHPYVDLVHGIPVRTCQRSLRYEMNFRRPYPASKLGPHS